MSVVDKYSKLIAYAQSAGVQNFSAQEQGGILYVTGTATEAVKTELWNIYNAIDPDMRAGDMVLKIESTGGEVLHEVQKNQNLSTIAQKYPGMTWQKILAANPEVKDPDKIFPGQKLRIPL